MKPKGRSVEGESAKVLRKRNRARADLSTCKSHELVAQRGVDATDTSGTRCRVTAGASHKVSSIYVLCRYAFNFLYEYSIATLLEA
jgi:hypothetical protein